METRQRQALRSRIDAGPARLLDQLRDVIRRLHASIRTEQAYVDGVGRFVLRHGKRYPEDRGGVEGEAFPNPPAVRPRRTGR